MTNRIKFHITGWVKKLLLLLLPLSVFPQSDVLLATDLKNYEKGGWTLPPSLRLGEKNKLKYLKIGESDRMTLKFIKP